MSALPGHRRGCVCPACLGAAIDDVNAAWDAFVHALATAFVEEVRTSWLGDAARWIRERRDPCPHHSYTGDEGPLEDLGRWPTRWRCDGCGRVEHESPCLCGCGQP